MAILALQKRLRKSVCVCAPSNNGVDELGVRLLRKGMDIVRAGNWQRINEQYRGQMKPRSVEFVVHEELQEYAPGKAAWKSGAEQYTRENVCGAQQWWPVLWMVYVWAQC